MTRAKFIIPGICFAVLSTPAFAKSVQAAESQPTEPVKGATLTAFQQHYVNVNPGSYLNVRQSDSIHSPVIARLVRGTEVNVLAVKDGWAKVKVNGKDGYVSTAYLTTQSISAELPGKTVTKYVSVNPGSRLNLREGPSTNTRILAMLANGTEVSVISESSGWAKVKVGNREGYVSTKYLADKKETSAKQAVQNPVKKYVKVNPGSHLHMRKNPSTNSAVLYKLKNGTEVTVYSEAHGWAQVKVNGKEGYVSTRYLSEAKPVSTTPASTAEEKVIATKVVAVNPGSNLNLRKSASTGATIIGKLPNGTKVDILSESAGWAKVKVNGKTGYVSTAYLKNEPAKSATVEKVIDKKIVAVNPGSNLLLRTGPSTKTAILDRLPNGAMVDIFSINNGWAKVKAKGKIGYVSTAYLKDEATKSAVTEKVIDTKVVAVNPGSNLLLRKGPSTKTAILDRLPNKTKVDIFSIKDGWAKVKVNGKVGYVSAKYLKDANPPESGAVVKYVNVKPGSHLNLRRGPDARTPILGKLPSGTKVHCYSERDGWVKVRVNGQEGYVSVLYLSDTPAPPKVEAPKPAPVTKFVSVNPGSNLLLRKGPSTSAAILGKFPNGTKVTVISESGNWAKVKVNGKEGYMSSKFLSAKKPDSAITTEVMYVDVNPGSNLNMRNKPSTDGSVIIKLARGVEVTVYEVKNGWAKIKVYGQEGYVSTEYLSATKPGVTPLPDETEKPGETPEPGGNDKPGGNENPGDNENPGGIEDPGGNKDTGDNNNPEDPGETENPGDAPNDEQDNDEQDGAGDDGDKDKLDGNADGESGNKDSEDTEPSEDTEIIPDPDPADEIPDGKTIIKYVNVNPGSNLNMRTGPSTNHPIMTKLPAGTEVIVHSEENGWAYVTAKGRNGYVSTQYLLEVPDKGIELPDQGISIIYQDYNMTLDEFLAIQMKANPQTDKKYAVYIREDALKVNNKANPTSGIVEGTGWRVRGGAGTDHWIVGQVNDGDKLDILSVVKGSDGYNWYQIKYKKTWVNASPDDVRYYLDPANFLENKADAFQFLKLSAPANLDPFQLNTYILSGKGVLAGHGATFTTAANKYGINEIYLIAHALLETGNGKSVLAQGVEIYGKTVYNMYGVGATDDDPIMNGAKFAYNAGWFTPEAAIIGGAEFIARNYIFSGQDTLYKMRWNPNGAQALGRATHQYATDIGWASKQVYRIFNLYNLLDSYQVILEVPKFKK